MAKADREVVSIWRFFLLVSVCTISFFCSIIAVIIGKVGLSVLCTIIYAVNSVFLERILWEEEKKLKKSILLILCMEAIQLIPWGLTLLICCLIS